MMVACGTSGYSVGMFHLTNHAFFKALLFLSAGSIIHALADEQDMRKMGGLLKMLPFTYNMMFIGSLSLMGFPFLTGFYSKDLILEWTYSQYSINSTFAYWLGSISAFLTAFYSIRVLSLTFLKKPLMSKKIALDVHEPYYTMTGPLFFLAFCSIFIGYILKDMMVGLGSDFWGNSIFVLPDNALLLEAEFLETNIKIFPVILSLTGGSIAFMMYNFFFKYLYYLKISFLGRKFYTFLNRKWFFDKIYNEFLVQHTLVAAYEHGYQNMDRGIIELLGPNGLYRILSPLANTYTFIYNNYFDTIDKLINFFKILFTMLFSIYLLILSYFFLHDVTIINNIDVKKDNTTFNNIYNYNNQIIYGWAIPLIHSLSASLMNSTNSNYDPLGFESVNQMLRIIPFPLDLNKRYMPWIPFDVSFFENVHDYVNNMMGPTPDNMFFVMEMVEEAASNSVNVLSNPECKPLIKANNEYLEAVKQFQNAINFTPDCVNGVCAPLSEYERIVYSMYRKAIDVGTEELLLQGSHRPLTEEELLIANKNKINWKRV